MKSKRSGRRCALKRAAALAVLLLAGVVFVAAQTPDEGESSESLAKATQNPVASLISVPFQNNINFAAGPYGRVQNVLNIQPVIPMELSDSWNLITRIIIPIIEQPQIATPSLGTSGFGDLNPTFFFSPAKVHKLIWGLGPTFSLRTETNSTLGNGKWGAGPALVALVQPKEWTIGFLANNIWSFAGDKNSPSVKAFLLQYFVNYNFKKGWYLTSSPILTASWNAPSGTGNQWVVPFGGGFGRIFRMGKQPVNGSLTAYYSSIRPDFYPAWSVRFQVALLYPKPK
jgi:hypothetical protein